MIGYNARDSWVTDDYRTLYEERAGIAEFVGWDLRRKCTPSQVIARLANLPLCLIGIEACVGAHHLSQQLPALGHDARLMLAIYVKSFLKGQKNDFRDAEAIAEAVQRARMRFVATKSVEQLDLQALHRVTSRPTFAFAGRLNFQPSDSGFTGKADVIETGRFRLMWMAPALQGVI